MQNDNRAESPHDNPTDQAPFGPTVYVTWKEVSACLRASSMTRTMRAPGFPEPAFYLGPKSPRWRHTDIEAWVEAGGYDRTRPEPDEVDEVTSALFSAPPRKRTPKSRKQAA